MKKRISVSTKNSIYLIDPQDILYCKSSNSSTTIFLNDAETVVFSKGINTVAQMLEGNDFIRPHQSYLVNRNHISLVEKGVEYTLVLINQARIPIATRRRKEIMKIIKIGN